MSIEMSNLEIAKKLFISKSTVDKYRRNLLWKFGSKNSIGVIRKAYEMGMLPMTDEDLLDAE
jgi:DNA-binding NarL/FixJ family response regulator